MNERPINVPTSPKGFKSIVANVGIKDNTKDFVRILSDSICKAAGVFTQNLFAGPSVLHSKQNIRNGYAQAVIAISKNANVANGLAGDQDTVTILNEIANSLHISSDDILIGSTGVIGLRYPMEDILPFLKNIKQCLTPANFLSATEGIMTTDKVLPNLS